MKNHNCEECGVETDLKGWYFVGPFAKFKKEYHWWCKNHFITHMFGLYPYQCTEKCRKARQKKTGLLLPEDDLITWVTLASLLNYYVGDKKSKTILPKCTYCKRNLKAISL